MQLVILAVLHSMSQIYISQKFQLCPCTNPKQAAAVVLLTKRFAQCDVMTVHAPILGIEYQLAVGMQVNCIYVNAYFLHVSTCSV